MRFISLNVNFLNKHLSEVFSRLVTFDADVICLQEFPTNKFSLLNQFFPLHTLNSVVDTESFISPEYDLNIVTLSKFSPVTSSKINYFTGDNPCLLRDIYYKHISHFKECHEALVTEIEIEAQPVKIINCRLSAAVRPLQKFQMLENIFKDTVCPGQKYVFCGDFNINQSTLFNFLAAPIRGFTINDIFVNQAKLSRGIFERFSINNPFVGFNTSAYNFLPPMQFDYILPTNNISVLRTQLAYAKGSDHKALVADLDIQ